MSSHGGSNVESAAGADGNGAYDAKPAPDPQDRRALSGSAAAAGHRGGNPRSPPKRKMSVSEEAEAASSRRVSAPAPVRCLMEKPFRTANPSTNSVVDEATGWAMDAAARGPTNQAGSFVGAAVLRYALKEAGCRSAACPNTVHGLRPGSLLTVATVITGVVTALSMPLVGAVVDHTRHRKLVGQATAAAVCAITGAQVMIAEDTWFAVLILEIAGGFSLLSHMTAVMAYLPDLSEVESELTHYTSRFNIVQYLFMACYAGFVIGVSRAVNADTFKTARIAAGTACGISSIYLGYAWIFLFRKRRALSRVPPGENLVNTGFKQIAKTARLIFTEYHALKWFMISLLWSPEAGAGVVLSIGVTFLTVQIGLTGIEIGIVNITLLVGTVPGSVFSKWFMGRFNPLISFRTSLLYFAIAIGVTCVVLRGPEQKNLAYLFAFLWGIAYGWVYPAQRVMQCTLIPKGQNNEIMGFFSFCNQIIGWLPALIFSIMNERGVEMVWGVALISFFLLAAIFFTFFIGDYDDAVAQVTRKEDESAAREEAEGAFADEDPRREEEAAAIA